MNLVLNVILLQITPTIENMNPRNITSQSLYLQSCAPLCFNFSIVTIRLIRIPTSLRKSQQGEVSNFPIGT
jgi:hypothetical protein